MTLFQATFGVQRPSYPTFSLQSFISESYFFIVFDVLALIILLIILVFLIRLFLRRASLVPKAFQKTILLITVPKESSDVEAREETIEVIRSQIANAESWLSTLGGMRAQRG